MTITEEVKEVRRQSAQTRAIAAYLETHGSISNFTAIYEGLPDVGHITRLGARIWDLRAVGYEIATEKGAPGTVYRLIAKPGPRQLTLLN
jgi:hypothetical protein